MPAKSRNVDPAISRPRAIKAVAIRDGRTADAEKADRELRAAMIERFVREMEEHPPPPLQPEVFGRLVNIFAGAVTDDTGEAA